MAPPALAGRKLGSARCQGSTATLGPWRDSNAGSRSHAKGCLARPRKPACARTSSSARSHQLR